jgi:hypothetical protein
MTCGPRIHSSPDADRASGSSLSEAVISGSDSSETSTTFASVLDTGCPIDAAGASPRTAQWVTGEVSVMP